MACGDKYLDQIKNDRGHTLDDPCGLLCSREDALSWQLAAHRWRDQRVFPLWLQIAAKTGDIPEAMMVEVQEYADGVNQPDPPRFQIRFDAEVEAATASMRAGACLLEKLEVLAAELGIEVSPPTPAGGGTAPAKQEDGGGWVIGVLAGGAAVLLGARALRKAGS